MKTGIIAHNEANWLAVGETFRKRYNGSRNFMTPSFEDYRKIGPYGIEISSGRGFTNNTIYGVTVLDMRDHTKNLPDGWNGCFPDMEAVELHLIALAKRYELECKEGKL